MNKQVGEALIEAIVKKLEENIKTEYHLSWDEYKVVVDDVKKHCINAVKAIINDCVESGNKTTVELVDSHHGIYAMRELASRYQLYDETGKLLDSAELKKRFDPDCTEDWTEENLEEFYVQLLDGTLWRCEWREGDIIAVNPKAEWDEKTEGWVIS